MLSAVAGVASPLTGGSSYAIPPATIVARDWVSTFIPAALIDTSTPLAFQNRVAVVTNRSYGASTNALIATVLPSGPSL
jgi:hypothetical protein